jgi:hypothetical protein
LVSFGKLVVSEFGQNPFMEARVLGKELAAMDGVDISPGIEWASRMGILQRKWYMPADFIVPAPAEINDDITTIHPHPDLDHFATHMYPSVASGIVGLALQELGAAA